MKQKDKFSIDPELLGIIAFLSRRLGPDVGCSGTVWFLREIYDQLKPEDIEGHLIGMFFDCLSSSKRELLIEYAIGKKQLSKEQDRYFRDIGCIYGIKPKLPKPVIKRCQWLSKLR